MYRSRCPAFTRSMTLHQIPVRTTARWWSAISGRGLGCGRPARAATRPGVRDRLQWLGFVPDYRFDGRSQTCAARPPGRGLGACVHGADRDRGRRGRRRWAVHQPAPGPRTSPLSCRLPRPSRLAGRPGGRRRTQTMYAPHRGAAEQSVARRPRGGRRRAAATACEAGGELADFPHLEPTNSAQGVRSLRVMTAKVVYAASSGSAVAMALGRDRCFATRARRATPVGPFAGRALRLKAPCGGTS
ncbi:hypothetical protein BX257_0617 [Streptomyces sp. 3212.3]|nr:hypothetical protein BX257_0617 [Streptomyces sp. 3212.3]